MKISIIGAGYVGLTTGLGLAEMGHQVMCFDHDLEKITQLQKKQMPLFEAGSGRLLRKHENKSIWFTSHLKKAANFSNIVFLCVNLESKNKSTENINLLYNLLTKIASHQSRETFIVIKSTAPVGTHVQLVQKLNKAKITHVHLITNPEFLSEGEALKNFLYPYRIIIASNSTAGLRKLKNIYRPLVNKKSSVIIMSPTSAEMTKHAANAFLATKISFINEISRVCEFRGANITEVQQGLGLDPRIGKHFLNPGPGYGGSCLPKDVAALIQLTKNKTESLHLLKAVQKTNDLQTANTALKIKTLIIKNNIRQITVWGASYKPGTDDIRNSPAVEIIKSLIHLPIKINIYDPKAQANLKSIKLPGAVTYFDDPYLSSTKSEFLIILTDWRQFQKIDLLKIKKMMKRNFVFDARNIYSLISMSKMGFEYHSIGRHL